MGTEEGLVDLTPSLPVTSPASAALVYLTFTRFMRAKLWRLLETTSGLFFLFILCYFLFVFVAYVCKNSRLHMHLSLNYTHIFLHLIFDSAASGPGALIQARVFRAPRCRCARGECLCSPRLV